MPYIRRGLGEVAPAESNLIWWLLAGIGGLYLIMGGARKRRA